MDNENDSTGTTAGSPVLGSSTFKRKFLKSRCNGKSAKIKLSDKFENESVINDENQKSNSFIRVKEEINLDKHELNADKFESNSNILTNKDHKFVGFQTASGKPLLSNEKSSEFANNLMAEILNPLIRTNREKKYSFLSKNSSEKKIEPASTKFIKTFSSLGFDVEDYMYSTQIDRTVKNNSSNFFSNTYFFIKCGTF